MGQMEKLACQVPKKTILKAIEESPKLRQYTQYPIVGELDDALLMKVFGVCDVVCTQVPGYYAKRDLEWLVDEKCVKPWIEGILQIYHTTADMAKEIST